MACDRLALALARWRDRVALWRAAENEVCAILARRYPQLLKE